MAATADQQSSRDAESAPNGFAASLRGYPVLRILLAARLIWPLALLALSALLAVWLAFVVYRQWPAGAHAGLLLAAVLLQAGVAALVAVRLRGQLLKPLSMLEDSVAQVCQGKPGASLEPAKSGVLVDMAKDIDSLSEELSDLYEDMDSRVARQTTRLAQKTASLKILYDVAASINQARTLDTLLLRFLRILKEMVGGSAATVRLVSTRGGMRLVGSIDLTGELLREEQLLPVRLCQCGKALAPGDILCEYDALACSRINGRQMFGRDEMHKVAVPLKYHGDVLGVYEIFVRKPGIAKREDILELLATIGSHLGMAVAKQRSDAEARRLSIIEERTNLAHELHDSLAQTLASLRFQVRMLQETVEQEGLADRGRGEVERIRNGLDEAHTELRELLSSFRAPVDQRGLFAGLERQVERFRRETGVAAFFQRDCREVDLSANEELQVLRIVQEALANARKHAAAHTVRVLLRCRRLGQYVLLVEDDGVGFEHPVRKGYPGEHIGLSIMRERALRLGAQLRIESEPGEGTRVELAFRPSERLIDAPNEGY